MVRRNNHKPLKCSHGLRRQTIVQALLADVFHGRLCAGQRLVTQELAQRFHVSHTPIREALIELAGIGVVNLLPNRGAVVHRVTAREVREMCQVRQALECAAARRACTRVPAAELAELDAAIRRLALTTAPVAAVIREARTLDDRLHDLITGGCGNAFLAKELGRLKILFRAFRDVAWEREQARNDLGRIAGEAQEHLAIVEALRAGDGKAAARAMARHIRSGAVYWCRSMAAAEVPPPAVPSRNGTRNHSR